ncbi:MAG: MBL fold metallo-hydrolase [Pseudomonadales bacterium]
MNLSINKLAAATLLSLAAFSAGTLSAAELKTQVFNPGEASLFPVTSTLITGDTEAVLIDAQFQRNDAQQVLQMIKDSGKELTTIYISHGDPDFYFGLDVITDAYPNAKVVSSASTRAHIDKTLQKKVAFWGPILAENAPQQTVVPEVLQGDTITIDDEQLKVVGLGGPDPKHTFVWIPTLKTVTGGVLLYENVHVWMADSQTADSRALWQQSLSEMRALKPTRIIPGHFIGKSREDSSTIDFTLNYVAAFAAAAEQANDSQQLVARMQQLYPNFKNVSDLELSAKVHKGEMQWP